MSRQSDFIAVLKWPALIAAVVAAALVLFPSSTPEPASAPGSREAASVSRVDMRDAMRMLHEEHDRVLDQADRQRAQAEQKAAEDAHAFEQARLAAAQEAARKLAEQRAAEVKRLADASAAKESRKPKPESVVAGAPLDIVPAAGSESGPPVQKPRGPIETVVAKAGDLAGEIKDKAVATVTDIKEWFSAAGEKLLGRDKSTPALPASRISSNF
jgi:hypothetical protein